MPELPEVETIRRDLAPMLEGRRIVDTRVYHDDLLLGLTPTDFREQVHDRTFEGVERRAKFLLFQLVHHDTSDRVLLRSQLRMTGRFALGKVRPSNTDFRHPGVDFVLDNGTTLFYDDVRRLGGFDLFSSEEWAAYDAGLGPEPLGRSFTAKRMSAILGRLRAPIKNALLDQRRVAGVGNIYASEALFRARVSPQRPANTLSDEEVRRLHRTIRAVLREALASAGTTMRDYRAVNGRAGSFQTQLRVYGRAGERCGRCPGHILRIVQAGRSSFLCPRCQL